MNSKAIALKQMVCFTLACAVVILLLSSAWLSAGAEAMPFKDVPAGKWYTDA